MTVPLRNVVSMQNVALSADLDGSEIPVLEAASIDILPGRYALLSDVAEARRPIVDLLAGLTSPQSGEIFRGGLSSWPIGRVNFAHRHLDGFQLVRLFSDLYSVEFELCVHVVTGLLSDRSVLAEPIGNWTQFSRIELCNSLALVPDFQAYLIDGHVDLGENRFSKAWRVLFDQRTIGKTVIISTYNINIARSYADQALVCHDGRFSIDPDLERALATFPLTRPANYRSSTAEEQDVDDESTA